MPAPWLPSPWAMLGPPQDDQPRHWRQLCHHPAFVSLQCVHIPVRLRDQRPPGTGQLQGDVPLHLQVMGLGTLPPVLQHCGATDTMEGTQGPC